MVFLLYDENFEKSLNQVFSKIVANTELDSKDEQFLKLFKTILERIIFTIQMPIFKNTENLDYKIQEIESRLREFQSHLKESQFKETSVFENFENILKDLKTCISLYETSPEDGIAVIASYHLAFSYLPPLWSLTENKEKPNPLIKKCVRITRFVY